MQIPTKSGSYELSTNTIAALKIRFPMAQVERELVLAVYWLERHPTRCPAKPLRFIENWLGKASPKAAMVRVNKWWESESGTTEQASALGLKLKAGESWAELRARIRQKEAA